MKRAPDHDAVIEILNLYVDGTYENDIAKLRRAFHPKALLSGHIHIPNAPPEGVMFVDSIEALFSHMEGTPSPKAEGAPYQARIGAVEVMGSLATAVVYEDALGGHDFVNSLQLHRAEDGWRIVSKAFYSDL